MHDVGRAVRRAISQEMGVGDHGVATRWVARQVISKKRHELPYPAVGTTPAGMVDGTTDGTAQGALKKRDPARLHKLC
jgi:hypothetical protein